MTPAVSCTTREPAPPNSTRCTTYGTRKLAHRACAAKTTCAGLAPRYPVRGQQAAPGARLRRPGNPGLGFSETDFANRVFRAKEHGGFPISSSRKTRWPNPGNPSLWRARSDGRPRRRAARRCAQMAAAGSRHRPPRWVARGVAGPGRRRRGACAGTLGDTPRACLIYVIISYNI